MRVIKKSPCLTHTSTLAQVHYDERMQSSFLMVYLSLLCLSCSPLTLKSDINGKTIKKSLLSYEGKVNALNCKRRTYRSISVKPCLSDTLQLKECVFIAWPDSSDFRSVLEKTHFITLIKFCHEAMKTKLDFITHIRP